MPPLTLVGGSVIKKDYGVTMKTVIISNYCYYQVHQHI